MSNSYLNRTDLPRGLRNNNPGNLVLTSIKWQGKIPNAQNTDGHFEQFKQIHWGIRAMMRDIINDITVDGNDTLRGLINEYAPPHENNTENYISFVSKLTGLLPDVRIELTKPILQAIVLAKITLENGSQYIELVTENDVKEAFDTLGIYLPGELIKVEETKKKSFPFSNTQPSPSAFC